MKTYQAFLVLAALVINSPLTTGSANVEGAVGAVEEQKHEELIRRLGE
jgi:hypothetical protein